MRPQQVQFLSLKACLPLSESVPTVGVGPKSVKSLDPKYCQCRAQYQPECRVLRCRYLLLAWHLMADRSRRSSGRFPHSGAPRLLAAFPHMHNCSARRRRRHNTVCYPLFALQACPAARTSGLRFFQRSRVFHDKAGGLEQIVVYDRSLLLRGCKRNPTHQ